MTSFLSTWVRSPRKGTLNIDWGRLLRTEQSIAVQLAEFDRWHRGIVELPCSSLKLSSPPGLLIGAQTANAGTPAEDMELKVPGPGRYPGAPEIQHLMPPHVHICINDHGHYCTRAVRHLDARDYYYLL